jgi:radical SAM superfamily enzyme
MAREYKLLPESFNLFTLDEYIDLCVRFAERLHPDIYIERFTSQSPAKLLIAPDWGLKNYEVTDKIIKRFQERNTCQGRLYHQENGLQ